MKIQSINIMCRPNKPNFTQKDRRSNIDRTPTVADLYEMEDRIMKQQKELIEAQNKKLSQAFYSTNNLSAFPNIKSFEYAQDCARALNK